MLRAIRRRKRLSQRVLASRIGVSQQELSRLERVDLLDGPMGVVDRWALALGGDFVIDVRVDGQRPLLDERHARLQNIQLSDLRTFGWLAEAEVSFSVYGERGRIDILAFHPTLRLLLVVEIKSRIDDVQEVRGRLDIKTRLALDLAAARGWHATAVVPVLIVEYYRTARRRVAAHAAMFASFDLRGRTAQAWLRRPRLPAPSGVLFFRRSS
jgi:transcriptional regulator with XRE-family HTH domain